jgi:hypothetical protein
MMGFRRWLGVAIVVYGALVVCACSIIQIVLVMRAR